MKDQFSGSAPEGAKPCSDQLMEKEAIVLRIFSKHFSLAAKGRRFCALLLSLMILLQMVPLTAGVRAATSDLINTAVDENVLVQDGVSIEMDKELESLGNGIFRLSLTAKTHIKQEYISLSQSAAANGYYVAPADGWYLVELYGGSGADGATVGTDTGGTGGNGGHVYGKIHLNKGETLIYTIGGNGKTTTAAGSGGGANGGGNKGPSGSYAVGGGGGYSAVYLIHSTVNRSTVSENERLRNYIMIAAGGGGGGVGNGLVHNSTGNADGGTGGNVEESAKGTLTGADNLVAGTYFAGFNGKSSGSSTSYVGRGGTSVPGARISDSGMLKTYTGYANDWAGQSVSDVAPGAGGDGNLRGGGGGAGFCGGGGGIMEGVLTAANVGGGGGGSSFIADSVDYQSLTDAEKAYLQQNNSATGGSCHITYLGADTAPFGSVSVKGYISKYFDITSINGGYVSSSGYSGSVTTSVSGDYTAFTAAGVNITPNTRTGAVGNVFKLDIMLRAKADFAGGNNVPVLYTGNQALLTPSGKSALVWKANSATDYANVPLNFSMSTKSYSSSDPDKTYDVTSLYEDEYSDVRGNLSGNWRFDFIDTISPYTVHREDTGEMLTGTVSPDKTTGYIVQYAVTPKAGAAAALGMPVSAMTVSGMAVVSIVGENSAVYNDITISGSKLLNYDGTYYKYGVNISQQTKEFSTTPTDTGVSNGTSNGTYTAPVTGWYYIQLRGGDGQGSGASHVKQYLSTSSGLDEFGGRGAGGDGGYVSGYVYLHQGEVLTYTLGKTTDSGITSTPLSCNGDCLDGLPARSGQTADVQNAFGLETGTVRVATTTGGAGGTFSRISQGNTVLMIAGGGGGAGGSAAVTTSNGVDFAHAGGSTGKTPATQPSTTLKADSAYNGGKGGNGTASAKYSYNIFDGNTGKATAGTAGTAGENYRNAMITANAYNGITIPESVKAKAVSNLTNAKNGTISITPLEATGYESESAKLDDFEIAGTLDKYFRVDSVSLDMGSGVSYAKKVTANADGTVFVSYTSGTAEVAHYTYSLTKKGDVTDYRIYNIYLEPTVHKSSDKILYTSDVSFTLDLLPAEGFLGGNDVPIAVYGSGVDSDGRRDHGVKISSTSTGQFFYLPAEEETDYANVDVQYRFSDTDLSVYDQTILAGQSVMLDALYDVHFSIPNDWRSQFVQVVYPQNETLSPTATTEYPITVSIVPKAEAATAVVVGSSAPAVYTKTATVYVEYAVDTKGLTHMVWNGPDRVLSGSGIDTTISPESGYLLPDSITVTVDGVPISGYAYDPNTGAVSVPASLITGNIAIFGSAKVQTFRLRFYYPDSSAAGGIGEHSETYAAGDTIVLGEWYESMTQKLISDGPTGHRFAWDWQMEPVDGSYIMPAQNWDVIGSYTPMSYTLTINYYKTGTTETVADPVRVALPYGSEYSYVSPNVHGYLADTAVVSGIIEKDTTVNVYYSETDGLLTIIYIRQDTGEEIGERVSQMVSAGTAYAYPSPAVTGYTPDIDSVSGTMTGDGVTVYVYYVPNRYTVTFDPNEGSLSSSQIRKTVIYNNVYGYDGTVYSGLPVPVRSGYSFQGWYDAKTGGTYITEESVYTVAGDQILYARWSTIGPPVSVTVEWGNLTYDYASREYDPETHLYAIPPEAKGDNYISVTNNETSERALAVSITYASAGENGISAYFTKGSGTARYESVNTTLEAPGEGEPNALTCYLWLEGVLPDEIVENAGASGYKSGSCIVTIGGETT